MSNLAAFSKIRHFIFDIDGVMTDGRLIINADGTPIRYMNIRDGYALQLAVKKGYRVTIISGATGEGLRIRFHRLGINDVHLGINDKWLLYEDLKLQHQFSPEQILYMGDDMPDLKLMQDVFLPACPSDACPEIRGVAKYVSPLTGGAGCVRDVIEKVLKLNGHWE